MKTFGLLVATLFLLSLPASAAEYIESFHSDIRVQRNGDLLVQETIRVYAEGKSIRRGIYRDFPTRYSDANGHDYVVGFELLSVDRDGEREPHHSKNHGNGVRVYIGDADVYLQPGFYEYRINYRTTRQLGFFDDFDELYWNVTGNGWSFAIDRASARVTLPGDADSLSLTGYTGAQGSTAQALEFSRLGAREARFETTAPLAPLEGLTIVVGWPKGLVTEPTRAQLRASFIERNRAAIILFSGILGIFLFYLLMWRLAGRDPQGGVIVPLYRAPEGYSPASMRFIERMGYDKTCFTAAVINLAVKGALQINHEGDGFTLTRSGPPREPLAAGEQEALDALFGGGVQQVEIKRSNHRLLSAAIDRHKRSLKRDYEKRYFITNSWLVVPAVVASIVVVGWVITNLPDKETIFETIFLGLFTLAPLAIIYKAIRRVLDMGKNGIVRYGIFLVPLFIFSGLFASSFPYEEFIKTATVALAGGITALLAMHYFFYQWLKAPTLAGRRLLDRIEGFRHYLEVAEKDEIAMQDAPRFTTEIYEAYLPYAIALELENEWTAKLDRAVAAGLVERGYSRPGWYRGHDRHGARFSSTLARSFDAAIASSSVAPGSSSGSSGGSSGGGGGGGGGGGW